MATASGSMNELASRTKPIKNTAAVYSYHPKGQGFFSNLSDGQSYFWRIRPHADRLPVQFAWRNAMRVFDLFLDELEACHVEGPGDGRSSLGDDTDWRSRVKDQTQSRLLQLSENKLSNQCN
jgi:hypothetical protein